MPLLASGSAAAGAAGPGPTGHIDDFDFQSGSWRVRHRSRRAGSTSWDEFGGECSMRKVMGGQGNIEDHQWRRANVDYRAIGVRTFDPKARTWSIFWIDSRWPTTIGSPVVGGFDGNRGVFYADDKVDGRPARSRFLWLIDGADECRWEQAVSTDAGENWDTNWYMSFRRIA